MKPDFLADPTVARIREARRRISEKCGHDPKRLVEYYMKLQEEKYADRLAQPPKPESQDSLRGE
jgi:hypothetical protein